MTTAPGARIEAQAATDSGKHLAFLDGVRGYAAGYVVLHHALLNLPVGGGGLLERALRRVTSYGHYAVDTFIVLSGYCLMLPVVRKHARLITSRFIARRAVRIVPPYYLALAFTLLLISTVIGDATGTLWDVSVPVTLRDVALHGLLVHQWLEEAAFRINHPHWSIGVEWQIYFFFPALLALRARQGTVAAVSTAVAVGYAAWIALSLAGIGNPSPWGSSTYYLGLFGYGMIAAELAESERARDARSIRMARAVLGGLTLATAAVSVVRLPGGEPIPLQIKSGIVGAWAASLLVVLRTDSFPWLTQLFSTKASVGLGKIGYSVYLLHAPLLQVVYWHGIRRLGPPDAARAPLMLLGSAALTLFVALPFYAVAEQPFHRMSQRLFAEPRVEESEVRPAPRPSRRG